MKRLAMFASLALAGCGRSPGVSDQELGNLVIAPKEGTEPIKLDKAARDPVELSRAMARPYRELVKAIGPHTFAVSSTTAVEEAGKPVSTLSDQSTVELGAGTTFHGVYTNSDDYGREVVFDGTKLYLRPRYQRWHGRDPESPEEPLQLRDSFVEAVGATWELLAPGAELTDAGAVQISGRQARKVIIKMSPSPRAPASEPLVQRKWREKRVVEDVSGEVVLDAESGLPLSAKLSGAVSFTRDGRRFKMKLHVEGGATGIGTPVPVAVPPADQVVATPERLREVDDRDFLLQGIAPPSRRNPDGSPVPPNPKFRDGAAGSAGSAAGSAGSAGSGSNSHKE